jgi:hypothetical protein
MSELNLVLPITKVDAVHRLVYGLMTSAAPDRSDEALDYAQSKPYFEAWSDEIAKASDGKSFGNVRAMHGSVAAGILAQPIRFDDAREQMECCAKIVDDQEWKKVEAGVYTGFSIGGSYVRRYKDGGITRYIARPSEVSLVDNPCNPDAVFQLIKQDGSSEARQFGRALLKEGRRNSGADLDRLQAIHDHCVALGASCHCGGGEPPVQKLLTHELSDLAKRLDRVERQPLPGKGVLVVVDKAKDSGVEVTPASGLDDLLGAVPDPRTRANLLLSRAGYMPAERGGRA